MTRPDFSRTATDYAACRPEFPAELFSRLVRFGIGLPGQLVLDVGAGTGLLGRTLARNGARVVLADPSDELLGRSPQLPGGELCETVVALAELLPFPDQTFDAATAAQCWHWFDRARAPRETIRVLRPGAALAIIYQMYLPLPGTVAQRSESLILRYRPNWPHANSTGISGQALRDMQLAGFVRIESFSFDVAHQFTHDAWRGLIRTTSAVGASMPPEMIQAFDADHARMLASEPATLDIPHRVFVAIGNAP